ncbi:Adenylate and Guanylate cyclase catalytic domain containing protein [Tritrichomonas foetus]|uniref:Adenylate and Guanylate cyclase catalytic domain containing protein n=1 Tax=Tritrichomonas foetus TaxID=1144522 RepID=A0A1J4JHP5_9EUKA|nr:Adenylate and Guanylate cyclase catalytic domain containing protein [Tritrichomonas foetus]|eukprot:OHS97131.1 Adenylate and Guanylate cyclase catalytic domain containing protein [Tritrichomonas foetus]
MKADDGAATVSQTGVTNSFSIYSSSNAKYGGLIERTPLKQLQKELSFLFDYIYSVAPSYPAVFMVMNILRFLQYIGPSLCTGYTKFWTNSDNAYGTISIISIFFYLIPPDAREVGGLYFTIVYMVVVAIIIVLLIVSAKIYQKNASLPKFVTVIVSFYFNTFGYYLHNCAFQFSFAELGKAIFKSNTNASLGTIIGITAASAVLSFIYIYIYLAIASRSLTFRADSLQTVTSQTSNVIFLVTSITTILCAFVESQLAPKILTLVFLIISALVYFASVFVLVYYGGIINFVISCCYGACCITSGIMCLAVGFSIILGIPGKMHFIIIFAILLIVSFIIIMLIMGSIRTKRLQFLDEILDDIGNFSRIKSVNQFINLTVEGFKIAHPICIEWQFSRQGIERWPNNPIVWYAYAKFVAIYPEETQTLWWIFRNIISNKIKGSAARTVKEQSMSIAREREPNLSPDLKNKLNSVTKHLSSTKHKLRHVWDLAIQGNISDMEAATKRAIREIEQSDAELLHILRQFPNNRFVTRQYARFCRELKADQAGYIEMIEKTRQLQRGLSVNKDMAHELGLATFQNLPDKAGTGRPDNQLINTANESATTSMLELEADEESSQEADESIVLVNRINNLTIPSTRWSIILNVTVFIILFAAPIIGILVYLNMFTTSITEPLSHMFYMAMLRTYCFLLTAFSEQRIYELLGAFDSPTVVSTKIQPQSVGGSWKTVEQLRYIITECTSALQQVELFRSFESGNENVANAQRIIFTSVVNYQYYTDIVPTPKDITIQTAMSDFILQQNDLINDDAVVNHNIVNTSTMLNPLMNTRTIANLLTEALESMITYESEENDKYQFLFQLIIICVIVFVIIFFFAVLCAEIVWINSNKDQVYRCLTSLPKNAVSTVAENLRVLKKEENSSTMNGNTEMSKQEDSILKIFVTGGTSSSSKFVDAIALVVCCVVIVVMHIGSTVILGSTGQSLSSYLRANSPHLNYLQGSLSYEFGALTTVVMMIVNGDPEYNVFLIDKPDLTALYSERIGKARSFYHSARFGGSSADDPPFSGFDEGVRDATAKIDCENENQPVDDFLEAAKCYAPDVLYILLEGIWNSRITPYIYSDAPSIDKEKMLTQIWSLMIFPIYDALFEPMTRTLVATFENDMDLILIGSRPGVIVMLIVGLVFIIIDAIAIAKIEKHIKSVLKLLLHVPASTVMSTSKIMTILSGNFKKNRNDSATRNAEFFREVVVNLPDAVAVTNNEKKFSSINKSFTRIFGIEEEDILGKTFNELFNEKFGGDYKTIIESVNNTQMRVCTVTYTKDGADLTLEATSMPIGTSNVVLFSDMTQTVRYNTLINEEKSKSDILLSSILPPSLVKRVQAGEKNISFAVQSATIVFMDIVSFTPWCGSLPADKVMSTLNYLFKLFDACAANYPTMTKIKCIGDCYMAAGGVFSEVNNPTEHAKEVVSFGLDALDSIGILNKELNESLQIRVGINSGGPIVAGVLGIGKPTFEILGPAINMAQQMEHHGVPMQVHVSRSVYELIYGDAFIIKERGSVEVKGGEVITYLVSRKKQK